MIVYKIKKVTNLDDAKPVIEAIKDFNKDKSAIWVPEEWAYVEGIGDFEKTTVVYLRNLGKKPIPANNIKRFLQKTYDNLGGEEFLKQKTIYIPSNVLNINIIEKSTASSNLESPKKGLTLFKVKTPESIPPALAFDMVSEVREMYGDTEIIGKNIFIPDSLLEVEVI